MIILRAHHLLCIIFFEGNGYSNEFVCNMSNIIKRLDNEKVMITNACDMICSSCNNMIDNKCITLDKVNKYDLKVIDTFKLSINTMYDYNSLNNLIKNNLNSLILKDICSDCIWYDICKNKL